MRSPPVHGARYRAPRQAWSWRHAERPSRTRWSSQIAGARRRSRARSGGRRSRRRRRGSAAPSNLLSVIEKRDDPAGGRLAALDRDWKRPDHAALVQGLLDVTAEVLDVRDALPEGNLVHHEEILLGPDLVHLLAHALLVLAPRIRPLGADGRRHGVIARAAVDRGPRQPHLD